MSNKVTSGPSDPVYLTGVKGSKAMAETVPVGTLMFFGLDGDVVPVGTVPVGDGTFALRAIVGNTEPTAQVIRKFSKSVDSSVAFDITLSPPTGQKIIITALYVNVKTPCYISIQMESGNELYGRYCQTDGFSISYQDGCLISDVADQVIQAKADKPNTKMTVLCIYYTKV